MIGREGKVIGLVGLDRDSRVILIHDWMVILVHIGSYCFIHVHVHVTWFILVYTCSWFMVHIESY